MSNTTPLSFPETCIAVQNQFYSTKHGFSQQKTPSPSLPIFTSVTLIFAPTWPQDQLKNWRVQKLTIMTMGAKSLLSPVLQGRVSCLQCSLTLWLPALSPLSILLWLSCLPEVEEQQPRWVLPMIILPFLAAYSSVISAKSGTAPYFLPLLLQQRSETLHPQQDIEEAILFYKVGELALLCFSPLTRWCIQLYAAVKFSCSFG